MMHTRLSIFSILLAASLLIGGCSDKKEYKVAAVPSPADAKSAPAVAEAPKSVETRPVLEYSPKPVYPTDMLARCEEGEARVTMRVTPEGTPADIKVVESTHPSFSDALMQVIPSWRFKPAEKDGVAVSRTVSIAIPFIMNNRPVDMPEIILRGKPELLGVKRPTHPGKGAAKAIVSFTIVSDTIVRDVDIVSSDGYIDRGSLMDSLGQWVFMPSRYSRNLPEIRVEAEIAFTSAGNVLIQYPYPVPAIPSDAGAEPPSK